MSYLWGTTRQFWQMLPFRWPFAAAFAAALGVAAGHNLLAGVCFVSGSSMAPTLQPGACLFTVPVATSLQRGDVVVIDDGGEDLAVKRIVGLPGETVQFWRGQVFVDRQELTEPYLAKNVYTFPKPHRGTCLLGGNEYFVMGDNRTKSVDSRTYGPVRRAKIKRRIHLPPNAPRAEFAPYLLPDAPGEALARRIGQK